jgi:L-ascorbate metabolism protein UlaG (beta-lactamase superfamily)
MKAKLYYLGHASVRIQTGKGKIIYIDPYAGEEYDIPADIILVTHNHFDHNDIDKVSKKQKCTVITNNEALIEGEYKIFDAGDIELRQCRHITKIIISIKAWGILYHLII